MAQISEVFRNFGDLQLHMMRAVLHTMGGDTRHGSTRNDKAGLVSTKAYTPIVLYPVLRPDC